MVTVNHKLEALTLDEIKDISYKYLMGWSNLQKDHQIMLRGLNKKRLENGLNEIKPEDIITTQIAYINEHYTKDEQIKVISEYMRDHLMNDARWDGFELFDCFFLGKRAIPTLKKLLGLKVFKEISETARLAKIRETQTEMYGGIGLANPDALQKSLNTRNQGFIKVIDDYKKSKDVNALIKYVSTFELEVLKHLISKFDIDDVELQYGMFSNDERYPYNCDFYIKSLDLFIEINAHYGHGDHWFDPSNQDDLKRLNYLRNSGSDRETRAAEYWSKNDISKRNTSKNNNLNYLVFWDGRYDTNGVPRLNDFFLWFDEYKCDTKSFIKDYPQNSY